MDSNRLVPTTDQASFILQYLNQCASDAFAIGNFPIAVALSTACEVVRAGNTGAWENFRKVVEEKEDIADNLGGVGYQKGESGRPLWHYRLMNAHGVPGEKIYITNPIEQMLIREIFTLRKLIDRIRPLLTPGNTGIPPEQFDTLLEYVGRFVK